MEDTAGELLDIACDRIMDLERPAYIKDSELRFVAVNPAYARLFGRDPDEFVGLRAADVQDRSGKWDIEELERRALVFGTEESAVFSGRQGVDDHLVVVERFLPTDDSAFVFGLFAPLHPSGDAETVRDEGALEGPVFDTNIVADDIDTVRGVLETAALPIGIFAEDGRPLVVNAAYRRGGAAGNASAQPPVAAQSDAAVDRVEAVELSIEEALDLLDVGVSIFDDDDRLIYRNARHQAFYGEILGDMAPGTPMLRMIEQVYDYGVAHYGEAMAEKLGPRDEWLTRRVARLRQPFSDSVEQMCDGRWLRCINRRLDNGLLLTLRMDVSELKEQELDLARHVDEAMLYRSVLEEMPVATFVRDAQHRLTFVNQAYADLVGMSREGMLNKTETEIFGDDGEGYHRQNLAVLDRGIIVDKHEEIVRADQQIVPVITRVARIETGSERYLVGSLTDVSTLKARERELVEAQREAESLHRDLDSILQSLPVGVLILDGNFDIEFANPAFYDIWEWAPEKRLDGTAFKDFVRVSFDKGWYVDYGADFDEVYERRIGELRTQYAVDQQEARLPNGKTLIITSKPLSGDKILVSYVDISATRDREREIQETRLQLERVGRFMQDATQVMAQGLLVVEDSLIVLSNDATAQILHVPAALTAPGCRWNEIFEYCADRGDFGYEAPRLLATWAENIAASRPISAAFLAAGTTWVQLEASFSGRGHWMFVLNDLTEMKKREDELKRLLARSEAADRAKSEFLANMSHEIRTPMNGVLGMAELLAKTDLDTRQRTFIDIIGKSGNALLTIINDILDFSKIDAGQMKLKRAPFDPVEAVEDVAALLSSAAADKDIELMVRSGPGVPQMVLGDAGRFRQIVTNLVGNAVKFTEKGHILIEVTAESDGSDGIMLSLRVEDTGIGIPQEKLEAIFDKFSQVDASSTRRHEGTGLGLAITSGLVDLFGGYIEVDSTLGQGAVFGVRIPMVAAPARHAAKGLPVNVKGARILVIDDNAVNRRILTEQLEMWGFDGFAAENGEAGIEVLLGAAEMGVSIDAIVLDYQMPDMNGAEVAQIIRQDHRFDEVSIIFLTSMDVAGDDSVFAALKVQAHLMKPARANVLRNTIVDVVRTNRVQRLPAAPPAAHALQPSKPAPMPQGAPDHRMMDQPEPAGTAFPRAGTGNSCDVLVAEDNEVNCIVFSQILQATDLRFMIVNNGQQAVDAWETYRPSIILMDVSMPVMNGHQATQEIRARETVLGLTPGNGRVPIIAVTAHALDSDRDLCLAAGMDDYLAKPISPEMLEEKIGRWLRRPGQPDVSGSAG